MHRVGKTFAIVLSNFLFFLLGLGIGIAPAAISILPPPSMVEVVDDAFPRLFMRACLYGADYPESWRQHEETGFNKKSPMIWCSKIKNSEIKYWKREILK